MRAFRQSLILCLGLGLLGASPASARAQELRTVAEKSDFRATSRSSDVRDFCAALARQSPLVKLADLAITPENRPIPLLILADPPLGTPEEAKKSGKMVVLLQANIHAGEVDGKEALLMLARDLALDPAKPLLKDLILVFSPNFNPDGNDRIDRSHRPEQNGPVEGVGTRGNAAGLDLNRDFVKLETPEVRALVRFLNRWDPTVVIDCHTTNGSHHRYTLTYDSPRHPACGAALVEFVRDRMLPEVSRRVEKQSGYRTFAYGNFSNDRTRWETTAPWPRLGMQYVGLRGRVGILSESYSYAPFRDRVLATRAFVRGCLDYVAEQREALKRLIAENRPGEEVAIRTEAAAAPGSVRILGFEEEQTQGQRRVTDRPRDYDVTLMDRVTPVEKVTRPYAYLFPAKYPKAAELLQRHGLAVEEFREDIELDLDSYRVVKIERSPQPYQEHRLTRLEVAPLPRRAWKVPAGTILVRGTQPRGVLAALLLEPRSEDGLATWNAFDEGLSEGNFFPVLRLPAPVPITAGALRPLAEDRTLGKPITVEALLGQTLPSFSGNPVGNLEWLEDGEHFLQVKEGKLYKVHARTGRPTPFLDPEALQKSLAALPTLDRKAAAGLARGPTYRMDPGRSGALFEHAEDLYFAYFDGRPAVRLTRTPGKKEYPSFSPDGKFVAFVREGNLGVVDLATQAERALTTDGGGQILNGKSDWVYEEEIFNRQGRAYWWSPDGQSIAFIRFDDAPVHRFTVIQELPTRQKLESIAYPKAGDPNPLVSLHVVAAAGGPIRTIDLSRYSPTASIISRVGWWPDGTKLYFYMQDRAQTWLDVCTASAAGGPSNRLLREKTPAWIEDPGELVPLADGSFLLVSPRGGFKHIHHFDASGKWLRPITSGPWELRGTGAGPFQDRDLHRVDAKNGWVYFTANKDQSNATNFYRARLDGSGTIERLTPEAGEHGVSMSPNGTLFVENRSDLATPARVVLRAADGALIRTIDTNPVPVREEYRFGTLERVQIPTPDGFLLEGTLVKPADFDPNKKYPVWFLTYGGPHAPTVIEAWNGGRIQEQVLASMGIVVFRCDPRSASGKGIGSAWTCYRQLGAQECKDVETAIDWLCKNPWIDPKRIGMSGHSYGGFLTAYCLTHSKKFVAGIAGAPVTDWHNYDSIYTERYMNTPQENPEGYAASSVVRAARNLHGKLMLLHGSIDDNVHPQNTLQLADALQRADRDFQVMFYPRARHGIFGRHYQRRMYEFIREALFDPPAKSWRSERPPEEAPAGHP